MGLTCSWSLPQVAITENVLFGTQPPKLPHGTSRYNQGENAFFCDMGEMKLKY